MRIFVPGEASKRGRAGHRLVLLFLLSFLISCSVQSPRKQGREDRLREDLRSFHWALVGQDIPSALRYVPADERDAWDESFSCVFEQLRLLEYRVELMKFRKEAQEASVRVRWTGHALNSLVVREILWQEQWAFSRKKQRWSLLPSPGALKGLPEDCLPDEPLEKETP